MARRLGPFSFVRREDYTTALDRDSSETAIREEINNKKWLSAPDVSWIRSGQTLLAMQRSIYGCHESGIAEGEPLFFGIDLP